MSVTKGCAFGSFIARSRGRVSPRKLRHRPMLSKGFLELAARLIGANTVSANGTRQAADLLQPLWEQAGLRVRRQVVDEIHVNLIGGSPNAAPGGVLLVTHLDTV